MTSLRDQIIQSAERGGASVGERLRAPGAAEALVARAHRRRGRRTAASAMASVAVLALAGLVAVELLRPPADPAGPVHRGDVPSIDRIVNPDAAGMFRCGAEPEGVPEQGVTIPDDADRDAHPTVEVGVFARFTAGGSAQVVDLPLDGSVAADPGAALVFATTVEWGEDGPPEDWGVATAGALRDESGSVVAVHDGVTVRGDLLPVVEQLRALEGGFDPYTCGAALAEGDYEVATVIQVWEGDPSQVVATYVNPGVGGDATVRIEESGEDVLLSGDDAARRDQGVLASRVASEGVPLIDVGSGMRAPVLIRSAWSHAPSCLRAAEAPRLDEILVRLPLGEDMEDKVFGTVEIREGDEAGVYPGVAWPKFSEIPFWGSALYRATLLLYDSSGDLAMVAESDSIVGDSIADDGTEWWADPAFRDPGCSVPADLPTEPGRYTPVYVYDLDGVGSGAAPDGWFVLPAFDYDGDPESLSTGLSVETAASGLLTTQ